MPIYDYKCESCGKTEERYAKMDQKVLECQCGSETKRIFSVNYHVHGDIEPYLDEHIGKDPVYITSKKHREQVMRREGVMEIVGKGWI